MNHKSYFLPLLSCLLCFLSLNVVSSTVLKIDLKRIIQVSVSQSIFIPETCSFSKVQVTIKSNSILVILQNCS